jgi:hypothetical protein
MLQYDKIMMRRNKSVNKDIVRFAFLTLKMTVFCDVLSTCLRANVPTFRRNVEVVHISGTLLLTYQITWSHIPEDERPGFDSWQGLVFDSIKWTHTAISIRNTM